MQEFGKDAWIVDGDDVWIFGIPFQTRMTVIRLPEDQIWLHSPIALTQERIDIIRNLGSVKYIVAPNVLHHLYVGDWGKQFPDAQLWGAPGVAEKRKNLQFEGALNAGSKVPWGSAIEHILFEGCKILPEIVFCHRSSKTLILTDLMQNHDASKNNLFWRTVKRMNAVLAPDGGVPRDLRLGFADKKAAQLSLERVLEWDFDKIILSHGICVEENAKDRLEHAFEWLQ